MARYSKFWMKYKEGAYDHVVRPVSFATSVAAVCLVLGAQKRLEKKLDKMQESREYIEKQFGGQYSKFLPQMELERKDREKMIAFLKDNSAMDPHF
ncbi:hypothetical protein MKW94_006790 [Papaver nudicaule]|uniref:Uncharacterized protein n=1 Tax=Papaver nudicaule TaxID=74823 RepID=A0AA41V3J0_PAPNU|nr:hypothetical protein [Papaver nudicaule]MCL7046604.1 hypothetical protein [Papaver nudicaule]